MIPYQMKSCDISYKQGVNASTFKIWIKMLKVPKFDYWAVFNNNITASVFVIKL
jgi:hypothetical protein